MGIHAIMFSLIRPSNLYACFLLVSIVLVLFQPKQVCCLGTGSTISVSFGSNTICGILAGPSQAIQCYRQGQIITVSQANVSYDSISGGLDFLCGLTSGGFSLHCWDTGFSNASFVVKTLYHNDTAPLTSLSVGQYQICALHAVTGLVQCWKKGSPPFSPPKRSSQLRTITSGGGYSCGIEMQTNLVSCWGVSAIGDLIESEFDDMSMFTLVAGKSHACGLAMSGVLICKGSNTTGQLNVPPNKDFEFSSVALGENHTCAIQSNNGSVVCWGGDDLGPAMEFMKFVIASFSFESIVAGLDFTCGLASDLTVICWGPGWPTSLSFSMSEIPFPKVIPGPCVNEACGVCGSQPNSTFLCGTKGLSICKSCVISPSPRPSSAPTSSVVSPPLQAPGLVASMPKEASKNRPRWGYIAFGSFGILVALISLFFIFRKQKARPMLESKDSGVPLNNARDSAVVGSNPSSAPHSRSSSITHSNSSPGLAALRTMSSSRPGNRAEKFSLGSLATATENFSPDNIIGSGSFGTVYRGRLVDGRPVAIKREEMMSERRMKALSGNDTAFDSELELLSRLHHKHLVGLVGFCQEKEERLLVYEYMGNGALHDHLHSDKCNITLNSWKKRIKVALDAARGIEYLHNYAVPPIIHRDIKSSNILIDSNWIGRVSDFGLSLMGSPSEHGEPSSLSTNTVGTVGYIDPEYYVLKVLTTKSDVYGFGVLLLELLIGKKAVFRDTEGPHPVGLVEYAGPYILGGEVWKVLDKRVGYPLLNEAEAVELVAYTALRCVSLEGKERPTMSDVVTNLEKAFILCKENHGIESCSRTVSSASFN